jgi:hypothetical protein
VRIIQLMGPEIPAVPLEVVPESRVKLVLEKWTKKFQKDGYYVTNISPEDMFRLVYRRRPDDTLKYVGQFLAVPCDSVPL